jgi:hypothetical protein
VEHVPEARLLDGVSIDDDASFGVKSTHAPARKFQGPRDQLLRAWPFKFVPELAYGLSQCLRFVLQGVKSLIRTRWDKPGLFQGLAQQVYDLLRFQLTLLHGESGLLEKQSAALVVKLEHANVAVAIRTKKCGYLLLKVVRSVRARHSYLYDRSSARSLYWRDVCRRSSGERLANAQLPFVLKFGKNPREVFEPPSCLLA